MIPTISISAWQCIIDEAEEFDTEVSRARFLAVRSAAAALGCKVPTDDAEKAYFSAAEEFESRYLAGEPINNIQRSSLILKELGIKSNETVLKSLTRELEDTHPANGLRVIPGATSFLKAARQKYRIVLLSDTWMTPGRKIDALLEATGIMAIFHSRRYSDQIGHHKINGTAFTRMTNELCVDPSEVIHIADHWLSDANGAVSAGIGQIFLLNRPDHPVPDLPTEKRPTLPNILYRENLNAILTDILY